MKNPNTVLEKHFEISIYNYYTYYLFYIFLFYRFIFVTLIIVDKIKILRMELLVSCFPENYVDYGSFIFSNSSLNNGYWCNQC